jgi:polyisoprenoid-binding protein YceI
MGIRTAVFVVGILFLFGSSLNVEAQRAPTGMTSGLRYEIDIKESKFMVHAHRGGLAWFKGHDHLLAVRDYRGVAELSKDAVNAASLRMTIRADSLEETSGAFLPQQKAIINGELKQIVLETAKYPEITFQSTAVTGIVRNNQIDVKIAGDITLHGVTRHIVIPASIFVEAGRIHARGEFDLKRSQFNVKATSAFHGLVRVKNKLTFTFDIVARVSS